MNDKDTILMMEQKIRIMKARIVHLEHMVKVRNKKLRLAGERQDKTEPFGVFG